MQSPDSQQASRTSGPSGSRYFRDSEPVWREHPAGPRFGDDTWDLAPLVNRVNFAQRRLRLSSVPGSWQLTVREILTTFAQPDHPSVLAAGVVLPARPAPPETVTKWFFVLRTIATWAHARDAGTPDAWTTRTAGALKAAATDGTYRDGGEPLAPCMITKYVTAVKLLRERGPVLSCGGLTFEPWPQRRAAQVARYRPSAENLTPPLPWDVWAATVKAAWFIADQASKDILAASHEAASLPRKARGPIGPSAEPVVAGWLAQGGRIPLHTGTGSGRGQRGQPNYDLLARKLGVHSDCFRRGAKSSSRRVIDAVEAAASDPARSQYGGLHTPSVLVHHTSGWLPWISEIGSGELGFLRSVLRAASYLLLTALTGMRDSEVQSLTRDAATTANGLPALRGVQAKGTRAMSGRQRDWWAPKPVFRIIEVLAALSPHPQLLFAPSAGEHSRYQPQREIRQFAHFIDADPGTRICRGHGLGLDPIKPGAYALNQSTMRRSFAVYASRYPAAELGLGIQLGHAALRMTAGYATDSQQQAARLFDTERRQLARQQVAQITNGTVPTAGAGGKTLGQFHAQIVADPQRAGRLAASIADRYHLGVFNDCMWDASRAGCGGDHPKLAEGLCIAGRCANATFTPRHLPMIQDHIRRIDGFLDTGRGHPDIRASLRTDRAAYAAIIDELTSSPHRQEGSQP